MNAAEAFWILSFQHDEMRRALADDNYFSTEISKAFQLGSALIHKKFYLLFPLKIVADNSIPLKSAMLHETSLPFT